MSIVQSALFVATYVAAYAVILLAPKTNRPQRTMTWLAASFFFLMGYDGLVAGICTLAHIPVSTFSQSVGHIILIALLAMSVARHKKVQMLSFTRMDAIALTLIILVVSLVSIIWFDLEFTPHYILNDPAAHFRRSVDIFEEGTVSGMYTAWNFIADWIGVIAPFIRFDLYYKIYCAADISFLLFTGLLFYAFASELLKNGRHADIIALIFSVLYILGYPVTCIIWGYCYLTVGISFSILIALLCRYVSKELTLPYLSCLAIALYGLITTYALFAPFLFALAFYFCLKGAGVGGRVITARTALVGIIVFAIPGLLGCWFFYIDILAPSSVTVSSALAREGGMYRNLYSNLVLFAPLILVTLGSLVRNRTLRDSPEALLFTAMTIAFLIMLIPAYYLLLSTYYLGKMQFAIWPFALLLAARGASLCFELPAKTLLGAYAAVVAFLCIMVTGRIDEKLDILYADTPIGIGTASGYHPYLDVYRWNFGNLRDSGTISRDVWDIFEHAADHVEQGEEVPLLGAWMYFVWYRPITMQDDIIDYNLSSNNDDAALVVEKLMDSDVEYVASVILDYGTQGNNNAVEATQLLLSQPGVSIVYQNAGGYIVRIER